MYLLMLLLACTDGTATIDAKPVAQPLAQVPTEAEDCYTCDLPEEEPCATCDKVHTEDEACDIDAALEGNCGAE